MRNLGFDTWYGRVRELAKRNNLDADGNYTKREITLVVAERFKMHWHSNLNDVTHNPILRTNTNATIEYKTSVLPAKSITTVANNM